MKIVFANERLRKLCNSQQMLIRRYGDKNARVIRRRLDDLAAAECLADMWSLPGRFHALTGDRKGQYSLDLKHPLRLILEPADEPPALSEGGGFDLKSVRVVRIVEITDTHEKKNKR